MCEFPLYVPVIALEQSMVSVMFVTNEMDNKNYFVATSFEPTQSTLEILGFNDVRRLNSQDELLKFYKSILSNKDNDIKGIVVYEDDYDEFFNLR